MLTIQHQAVSAWGWPAMKMDFPVIESMDLSGFSVDDEFNFLIKKNPDGSIEIIEMNKEGL
jgi:Cu/Ag efflux protein CusF